MPALPSPGNVIKVRPVFNLLGDTAAGTQFFLSYTAGPPTATGLDNLAAAVNTYFTSDLASLLSVSFSLVEVVCTDLSSSSGAFGQWTGSTAGTRTGNAPPINTCCVIDYEINRRYRGGKPRGYWPFGVIADTVDLNQWSSTLQSSVNSGFGSFMSSLLAFTLATCTLQNHVNVGYYSGFTNYTGSGGRAKVRNNVRTTPAVDSVVTHKLRVTCGSQRRRLTA